MATSRPLVLPLGVKCAAVVVFAATHCCRKAEWINRLLALRGSGPAPVGVLELPVAPFRLPHEPEPKALQGADQVTGLQHGRIGAVHMVTSTR